MITTRTRITGQGNCITLDRIGKKVSYLSDQIIYALEYRDFSPRTIKPLKPTRLLCQQKPPSPRNLEHPGLDLILAARI